MRTTLHSWITIAVVSCLLLPITVVGLNSKQQADSVKQLVETQRTMLQQADGAGDVRLGIALRLRLATLLKPKASQQVLEEGAMMASAAKLLEEEITIRTYLAQAYAAANDHRKAYAEALLITALMNERMTDQAERSGARTDSLLARVKEEHGATVRADMIRQLEMEENLDRQKTLTKRWMFIALGMLVIGVLALVFMMVRIGRRAELGRLELAGLRAEITALKSVRPNQYREALQGDPSMTSVGHGPAQRTETDQVDDTLLAVFQKRAPERLATLEAARAAGDTDKVVRVVHTLKPLLVAFNADRFGALCPRITDLHAQADRDQWNADLDTLEKGIRELLSSS
jgi:HPt (histidine-containing phosphotransfer) domain-containing protein